jgi:hypothetical protein
MSDRAKIQELNRKLQVLEQRPVTNWERPILEVARRAILQEVATVGRRFARWNQMIPSPVFVKSER